ncbi:MAG: VOC family protein [Pseudonocardiales bacterium]|nr:VOC family protein [Pseudonocardiales bacterium]
MALRIATTSIDARDAYAQSVFWAQVLGFERDPDDPDAPGDEECLILAPDGGQRLLFLTVPEDKRVKNRLHLDLEPVTGTRDAEVARVRALGATVVDDRRRADGTGWVVLADPEGNEFCVVRGAAERAAPAAG